MTNYNVWRADHNRWVVELDPLGLGSQDSDAPIPLTYIQARRLLEYFRVGNSHPEKFQVRELPDTKGEQVGYNVWCKDPGRWTRNGYGSTMLQDDRNPVPLTYAQAKEVLDGVGHGLLPDIMEIGEDLQPQPIFGSPQVSVTVTEIPPTEPAPVDPPQPTIDWDVYNGVKGMPVFRMRDLQKDVDPYTGLPKEKK